MNSADVTAAATHHASPIVSGPPSVDSRAVPVCDIMLCYIMLCNVMLCNVVLCYVMFSYIMLCYV